MELNVEAEAYKIDTKFVDNFSKEIYEQTYKYGDEDINGTHLRIAKDLASIEKNPEHWTQEFLWALEDFKFVPGGRIISNAGTGLKGTTYINCFTPDTNVLTKYGYRKISEIKIGDEVITHTGNLKPVTSVMKREYNGEIDVYKSSNLTGEIKNTPEHPFYQGDNKWIESDFNNKLVLLKNNVKFENKIIDLYDITVDIKRNGVESNNIYKDDNYVYTITEAIGGNGAIVTKSCKKVKRFITVDNKFAYAIGRYVGDGSTFCIGGAYEVDGFNIIFNDKEIDSMLEIKSILENSFGLEININKSKDFDASYLRKSNPIISYFLLKSCGRYSNVKKIPDFIWESNKEVKLNFLMGLFDADGTITKNEAKIVLNNESLTNDMQALFLEVGIPTTKLKTYVKNYPNNIYYCISLVGKYARNFVRKTEKVYADNRISEYANKQESVASKDHFTNSVLEENNNFDGKIFIIDEFEKIKENYNGFVFNISVLDDESYVVNNVVVHNCFVDGFIGEDQDSMESILDALRRQALILKSEGGYGFCADVMRPRGGFIHGIGNESPGSVRLLDMWDTQSAVITEGSGRKTTKKEAKVKIRKGAQMVTMSCFSENTIILTNEGWLNVKDIVNRVITGDIIYAIDDTENKNLIKMPFVKDPQDLYRVETEDGEFIEVTGDHKFEVKNVITNEIYLKAISEINTDIEFVKIIS